MHEIMHLPVVIPKHCIMKNLIILFVAFPFFSFSQDIKSALTLSGGAEYQKAHSHAWNVELSYQNRMGNSKRFWSEFGVNYSVLEYNGDSQNRLDTTNISLATTYAQVNYFGSFRRESVHYSRSSFLRFQAGTNFTILDQEKLHLTAGVNLVSQIEINHWEHGQRLYLPMITPEGDTLSLSDVHYSSKHLSKGGNKTVSLYVQPHIDASYLITNDLAITARLAYYRRILFYSPQDMRLQLNLGIQYYL